MNRRLWFGTTCLGLLLLGVIVWQTCPLIAATSPWRSPVHQPVLDSTTVWNDLANVQVIYLGEVHDRAEDHAAQLEIIQTLHQHNPKLAIGMEMFQRPYQASLDNYLTGAIDEATLRQQSDYDRRWGFDWEHYAPLLRFAKTNQLPVLALNVPTEITRRVAQNGLAGITATDRQWVPPDSELRTDNANYRAMLAEIYQTIHHGHSTRFSFANFELAQVLWDETMAETIANFWQAHRDRQIVVLAGKGHIIFNYGIPSRVARRLSAEQNFQQRSVLLNPDEAEQQQPKIADYFWQSTP